MTGEELYAIYRSVANPIHKKRGHHHERRFRELRYWQRKLWNKFALELNPYLSTAQRSYSKSSDDWGDGPQGGPA